VIHPAFSWIAAPGDRARNDKPYSRERSDSLVLVIEILITIDFDWAEGQRSTMQGKTTINITIKSMTTKSSLVSRAVFCGAG
jgi:hypothetical protein